MFTPGDAEDEANASFLADDVVRRLADAGRIPIDRDGQAALSRIVLTCALANRLGTAGVRPAEVRKTVLEIAELSEKLRSQVQAMVAAAPLSAGGVAREMLLARGENDLDLLCAQLAQFEVSARVASEVLPLEPRGDRLVAIRRAYIRSLLDFYDDCAREAGINIRMNFGQHAARISDFAWELENLLPATARAGSRDTLDAEIKRGIRLMRASNGA